MIFPIDNDVTGADVYRDDEAINALMVLAKIGAIAIGALVLGLVIGKVVANA